MGWTAKELKKESTGRNPNWERTWNLDKLKKKDRHLRGRSGGAIARWKIKSPHRCGLKEVTKRGERNDKKKVI